MTLKRRNLRWEEVDKNNIPLDKLIRHYESFNRTEAKFPRIISWYSDTLYAFEEFLKRRGSALLRNAGINEVREFILYLQEKEKRNGNGRTCNKGSKLSPFTVQGFVRSLKAFYSWLYREGYTDMNELARLRLPKTPKNLVQTLSQDEIRQILGCLNPLTAVGTRDIAIFMTFIDTGLRCSELVGTKLKDVDMEQGPMKVLGKGSRERIVPIGNGGYLSYCCQHDNWNIVSFANNPENLEAIKPRHPDVEQYEIRRCLAHLFQAFLPAMSQHYLIALRSQHGFHQT